MNIGFDAKRYFHNHTGLGNYSRDLVDTLCRKFANDQYFLFDKRPSTINLPANTIAVVPLGNKILWREAGMLKDVKRFKLDVFHGLSNELPWGKWPSNTRKIVTIHDVIFDLYPRQYAAIDRYIYRKKTAHALKTADIVIATSQATANDLVNLYHIDENKISVIYQTCGQAHWKPYDASEVTAYKNKRQLNRPFILYVSSFQPRKNHLLLLKAFKLLADKHTRLVLAGRAKETYKDCARFVKDNQLENRVVFLTDISNAELPLLYRCAQSFVYPSMVEGFGIPLIEAACAGLPIAASDIPVFNEIAPQGTLFFDFNDPQKISSVMQELIGMKKPDHNSHLKVFTPEFAAGKMMEIYRGDI
jgi:glycosyltransferase involved in cell wall biosynthesis